MDLLDVSDTEYVIALQPFLFPDSKIFYFSKIQLLSLIAGEKIWWK